MIQKISLLAPIFLNNGLKMPRIGLGTLLLKGEVCRDIVERAVLLGYRHIDTAQSYENEADIGTVIRDIEGHSNISRKQIFVSTKVHRIYHHPRDLKASVDESLEKLKSNYIDMLHIHSPWGLKNHGDGDVRPTRDDGQLDVQAYDLNAAWKAMEELVKEGKVKSIGLSNFSVKLAKQILSKAEIKPQNLQFECHAYYQQRELISFCQENEISCTAYSPLGAPKRPEQHIVEGEAKDILLEDETVLEIAANSGRTPAQILLRFLLEQDLAVIPKTNSFLRLEENIAVSDFELSESDVEKLKGLDRGRRYFTFKDYIHHPYFPAANETF